ncbi:MAG: hypothetical protein FWC51_04000 [Proteobacteria bacterium]|nr:hypothetical protein [Pseudomonadota bacterium]
MASRKEIYDEARQAVNQKIGENGKSAKTELLKMLTKLEEVFDNIENESVPFDTGYMSVSRADFLSESKKVLKFISDTLDAVSAGTTSTLDYGRLKTLNDMKRKTKGSR